MQLSNPAVLDLFKDTVARQMPVKRNPNVVLELMITQMQMQDKFKAMYPRIHDKLAAGPERKFSFVIYDTRTASAQIYALREVGERIDWKHRIKRLPLAIGHRRLQNNIKVVVHQLITKDAIQAGMRLRSALDSTEAMGYLHEGTGLEYHDLEAAFEGMEIDDFQQFHL